MLEKASELGYQFPNLEPLYRPVPDSTGSNPSVSRPGEPLLVPRDTAATDR